MRAGATVAKTVGNPARPVHSGSGWSGATEPEKVIGHRENRSPADGRPAAGISNPRFTRKRAGIAAGSASDTRRPVSDLRRGSSRGGLTTLPPQPPDDREPAVPRGRTPSGGRPSNRETGATARRGESRENRDGTDWIARVLCGVPPLPANGKSTREPMKCVCEPEPPVKRQAPEAGNGPGYCWTGYQPASRPVEGTAAASHEGSTAPPVGPA